jgi:hypothetical protein
MQQRKREDCKISFNVQAAAAKKEEIWAEIRGIPSRETAGDGI